MACATARWVPVPAESSVSVAAPPWPRFLASGSHPEVVLLSSLEVDPTRDVAGVTLPLLVIQGERDYQVGLADYDRWRRVLAGRKRVRFRRFPGLDHTLARGTGLSTHYDYYRARHVDPEVIEELARWLDE